MRRSKILAAGMVAAIALPSLAQARSYCEQRAHDRKVTGTILGGVAGALVGSAVDHHGGALIGGLGGAVIGNQLSRTSCDHRHAYYRRTSHRYAAYDSHRYGAYDAGGYGVNTAARCHYETRSYYNERGQLVYAPTQVCR